MITNSTKCMKLLFLAVFSCFYSQLFSNKLISLEEKTVWDTIISNPISVDSLYIFPSAPKEGDTITLYAATTHSSSPCGLLDYKVLISAANQIYVDARYWEGMLTAICHSTDKMNIGSLKAGRYILNFMNMKKIEFTVYPDNNCRADFHYEYLRCTEPARCINTVQFFDKSGGNITAWEWDFGDSTISNEQNPVHTYKNEGIYNVCLKVTGGTSTECIDMKCKVVPVPQSNCKALFKYEVINVQPDASIDSSMVPFPSFLVKFTNLSAGNIVAWKWDFGDGSFSTLQNPVHRYIEGEYIVTLKIATNEGCESSYTDTLTLFNPIPICKFTGTVRDYSGLDGCKYIIELDNGIKLEPVRVIPPFVFRDSQRVILAYRPLRVASICMVGITAEITCIRELPTPVCNSYFYYQKDTFVNCICYNFYDKSIGRVNSWHWDFGDGNTSSEQNPKHVFNLILDSAAFNVCLTIKTADGCQDTWCEKVIINPTVPWTPVIGGDDNHSIVIPHQLQTSVKLEKGDYIGLFFKDFFGKLVCGGMIPWEGVNDVLTAWENTTYVFQTNDSSMFPIPWYKNGFNPGEKFEFKIWKWRTNKEILIQEAEYTVNNMFPDSGFYTDDGLSLLKSLSIGDQQTITLHKGWNLNSLYLTPNNIEMKEIFGDKNVIIKNYKGEIVYFPAFGITDGIWNSYEGYKIKAFEKFQVTVNGTNIHPQTVIPLPGNKLPYFLPYYYTRCYPIKLLMYQINNNIRYVQTYSYAEGRVKALNYIPKYGIDQIKYMEPGYAYKLSLLEPMRSFVYPPIDLCDTAQSSNNNRKSQILYGENNRVLVIPEDVLSIGSGAIVKAYTTNGTLVGDEIAEGGSAAVTLWDTDIEENYDEFVLEITENEVIQSYKLSFSKNTISDGELHILQGIPSSIVENNSGRLKINVYPTIVNSEFYIDLNNEKSTRIEIYIYDLLGKAIKQGEFRNLPTGTNHLTFNVGELAAGQYIYLVKTNKLVLRGKMQIRK